jgi:predicted anti-sigma-YlaC factor YlaD
VEQQLAALQQQVQALQDQVAALQSVIIVTLAEETLQGQTVTISSTQGIVVQSQKNSSLIAGMAMNLQSGATLIMKAQASTRVEEVGELNLIGTTIKLNTGNKQVATVGSAVANGKILTGSPVIFGNCKARNPEKSSS